MAGYMCCMCNTAFMTNTMEGDFIVYVCFKQYHHKQVTCCGGAIYVFTIFLAPHPGGRANETHTNTHTQQSRSLVCWCARGCIEAPTQRLALCVALILNLAA